MTAPFIFYGMKAYLQCPCAHVLAFADTLAEGLARLNADALIRADSYFAVFAITERDEVIHIHRSAEGWVAK